MTTSEAHREIRHAYVHGGPGAFVSATIWLIAAMVERRSGVATAFATLFFGGFLIFPLGQRYWLFGALLTGVGAIEIVSSGTLPGGRFFRLPSWSSSLRSG